MRLGPAATVGILLGLALILPATAIGIRQQWVRERRQRIPGATASRARPAIPNRPNRSSSTNGSWPPDDSPRRRRACGAVVATKRV